MPQPPAVETGHAASPSSAPARPAWPPRSSCAAPAIASCCSSATRRSAGWCASACRTSRSRSRSSSAASSSCAPRASSSAAASTSGATSPPTSCAREFDAVVLATGSRVAARPAGAGPRARRRPLRDGLPLRAPARRSTAGREARRRSAPTGKHVVVIGGGDTGADCVGNAIREGAASVTQLELLPEPPTRRPDDRTPWPLWPQKFRLSYAMEEARAIGKGEQDFSVVDDALRAGDGRHASARCTTRTPRPRRRSARCRAPSAMPAAARAAGDGLPAPRAGAARRSSASTRTRAATSQAPVYETSSTGVFAAGDARRGQSLIVWAINEGRQAARMADRYLRLARRPRPVESGNVHDADDGPEGPPQHVNGALVAEE